MAQNTTILVPALTWTELTNDDVTSITFQNRTGYPVFVKGTEDDTAPSDASGAIRYNPGQGELNVELADLFPGITAVRLWAFAEIASEVTVSHA
jgi:hypothetical protein